MSNAERSAPPQPDGVKHDCGGIAAQQSRGKHRRGAANGADSLQRGLSEQHIAKPRHENRMDAVATAVAARWRC
jgi:hypothetical protein